DVNAMRMRSPNLYAQAQPGALFKRRAARSGAVAQGDEIALPLELRATSARGKHRVAFACVYLFMLLLYARPNDLFPILGSFPLVKIVAISALLIYFVSKISAGERLVGWTLELAMLLVIVALGLLLTTVAASPKDSLDMLTDPYLKTVVIFILMVN